MYCAAPGSVQPSAGKVQTVTAISELVGDAGGVVAGADVAEPDAAGEVAGLVAAPSVVAVRDGGAWLSVGVRRRQTTPKSAGQARNRFRYGPVPYR
jgi:hypothetical protein